MANYSLRQIYAIIGVMADTTAKLSLLLLPQEIRDIIYDFVYTETTIHSKRIYPKFHFTGIYHCPPPRLSAVCKQLRAEAEDKVFKQKHRDHVAPKLYHRYLQPHRISYSSRHSRESHYWNIMIETPSSPEYFRVLLQAKVDVRLVHNREREDPVMNNFKMIGVSRVPEGARTTIYVHSSRMSAKQETAVTWRKALCELLAQVVEQLTRACPEPLLSDPCNPKGDACVEHGVELQMAMFSVLESFCGTELSVKELLESSTWTPRVKLS
ncbi:hypothetical protein CBER1_03867 [Cercospora berteroae]|uniref:Uncharacterized protein n=1 Tax=Cercospora berteroae TaxID=357750 RepID=A0A2S6CEA0_9PEZI|nr:hypothetical protein CBER1_03867 [Cercospora berteroae]